MFHTLSPSGEPRLIPLGPLVALHKLDAKPPRYAAGTRLLLAQSHGDQHTTRMEAIGESVEVVRERLRAEHGIRTLLFSGLRGDSYLCVNRLLSVSPGDNGGSVIKLSAGPDGEYWKCYVVESPEEVRYRIENQA